MDESPDPLEDLFIDLRRRALHVVDELPSSEELPSPAAEADIVRVNELIEKYGWHHLRRG